jgi:GTPase SAR1 family protein
MGVVYIGDRSSGKTHLALELLNPRQEVVKASSTNLEYEYLKSLLSYKDLGATKPTDALQEVDSRQLQVQVRLPSGFKSIRVDWIDTPGEIWRKRWQEDNPDKWQNALNTVRQSNGILLILSPHRNIVKPDVDAKQFLTEQQWCNRFNQWGEFFRRECSQARRLVICLNKADLFCDPNKEASELEQRNWQQRHSYVLQRYFPPIKSQLEQLNRDVYGLSVSCFITSIYQRKLLELPWLYLGTFL